ncbi:phosphoribosyltransferase family protein [Pseudoclavibacter sp. VKM Ac-2867]|uniref:phosphoribosyltransferase family protein n=1 Tax=Pseudoclavibacter sp. VKM Ac-2867 TaxID=2783829 RepID=UPI00188A8DA9|nr:phosphoribosyltransferase family protein [Pseudoclavibacter sp. VKM Ac-2867]MBF4459365.1 ribose-phosphate pyrophosphokinase [Pseudoclavibacter sp. VKM Ac-2867]
MSIHFQAQMPSGWKATSAIRILRFPGGEITLVVPADLDEKPAYATVTGADPSDLITLGLWADYAHQLGQRAIAVLPYLPAARADRGMPFGAKVYAELINSFGLDQVIVFDPHSSVAPGLIDNVKVVGSAPYVRRATIGRAGSAHDYVGVLAPDAGAVGRAQAAASALHLPLFRAEKHRDFETGKLSGFSCEALPRDGRLLVVDDICDGGGTFRGLAEATRLPKERLTLYVSHGVFSGDAPALRQHFGEIITTDSHPGSAREGVATKVLSIRNILAPYVEY